MKAWLGCCEPRRTRLPVPQLILPLLLLLLLPSQCMSSSDLSVTGAFRARVIQVARGELFNFTCQSPALQDEGILSLEFKRYNETQHQQLAHLSSIQHLVDGYLNFSASGGKRGEHAVLSITGRADERSTGGEFICVYKASPSAGRQFSDRTRLELVGAPHALIPTLSVAQTTVATATRDSTPPTAPQTPVDSTTPCGSPPSAQGNSAAAAANVKWQVAFGCALFIAVVLFIVVVLLCKRKRTPSW